MTKTPDTIVFIHGLWMTPRSWEQWAPHYESRGYRVLAPAWPGLEVEVEALTRDPSPLTKLDVGRSSTTTLGSSLSSRARRSSSDTRSEAR